MGMVWDVLQAAVQILIHNDYAVYSIALRSLYVSGTATLISLVVGVGAGAVLAFRRFPGRLLAITLVNTGMGFPPVVIGLFVALLLWRSGPFGDLGWIYTNRAMIIAQVIIATPVITGFTAASLSSLDPRLRLQVYALGASRMQMLWILLQEVRLPLLAAVMAGFGAAISEVGASVMVGGQHRGADARADGRRDARGEQGQLRPGDGARADPAGDDDRSEPTVHMGAVRHPARARGARR